MKLKLDELKKAVGWIEANSRDVIVNLYICNRELRIECEDKYQKQVEITLWNEGGMLPKIKKTEILP